MWYKIQVGDFTDPMYLEQDGEIVFSKNYVIFTNGEFKYTRFQSATYFLREHLEYDDRLKEFLDGLLFRLIECPGFHAFPVYHGKSM